MYRLPQADCNWMPNSSSSQPDLGYRQFPRYSIDSLLASATSSSHDYVTVAVTSWSHVVVPMTSSLTTSARASTAETASFRCCEGIGSVFHYFY